MSRLNTFQLIVNNSYQDELMTQSSRLLQTIENITRSDKEVARDDAKSRGKRFDANLWTESYIPKLAEIAQYHTIPVVSFFKPFVACAMEYIKHSPTSGQMRFGADVSFTLQQISMFVSDIVFHLRASSWQATSSLDKVRWSAFPGHRVCEHTRFTINGNPIDDYYSENYVFYYEKEVPSGQKDSWKRCVGQQLAYEGTLIPDPSVDEISEVRRYTNGPQTLKRTQPELDMWIPLLFWFRDPAFALPNGIISHGQVNIDIKLADVNDLIAFANLGGGGAFSAPTILQCELYVNNISIVPELQEIFLARSGALLIRIHKHMNQVFQKPSDQIKLKDFRFPVEKIHFAFRPRDNLDHSQEWYKMCVLTQQQVASSVVVEVPNPGVPPPVTVLQLAGNSSIFHSEDPSVDFLSLYANTIPVFENFPESFFANYVNLQTGNCDQTAASSLGIYTVNFNVTSTKKLHGWAAPSGYLNASRARELILAYRSSFIGSGAGTEVDFIATAQCINFLKLEEDSAILRYAT
jgi:hypothetical protein